MKTYKGTSTVHPCKCAVRLRHKYIKLKIDKNVYTWKDIVIPEWMAMRMAELDEYKRVMFLSWAEYWYDVNN